MRGDYVEIVIDAGDTSQTYTVEATRAGRRVEVIQGRSVIEVTEVTRGGTPVRTARFMAARVLALVEHPANSVAERHAEPPEDTGAVRALPASGQREGRHWS